MQQGASSIIFQTDKTDPQYTDEEGVDEVGKITIELPGVGIGRRVEYSITFGSTELEVEARDLRPGGARTTCTLDFLSY